MTQKRGKLDIIIEILTICKNGDGACKTNVVYKTNINFKLADYYINILLKYKLLEKRENKYSTTDNGSTFLEKVKDVILLLE